MVKKGSTGPLAPAERCQSPGAPPPCSITTLPIAVQERRRATVLSLVLSLSCTSCISLSVLPSTPVTRRSSRLSLSSSIWLMLPSCHARCSSPLAHASSSCELQVVQGKLNTSERTVSSLRACVNTGRMRGLNPARLNCCPFGWVLFKSKCLYISVTNKTWEQSKEDCARRFAQLLVQDEWTPLTVPVQSRGVVVARRGGTGQSLMGPAAAVSVEVPGWHHEPQVNGEMWNQPCDKPHPWICEISPKLNSASETRPFFLAKD
uniref:C-type lectin domain-containing protein n=1 Tax=Serinus canaria TaxID=9135 RepID=A0A8C9MHI1_SERCA